MIESGPIPAVHGVVRWRLIDLAQWILFLSPNDLGSSRRRTDAPWLPSGAPQHLIVNKSPGMLHRFDQGAFVVSGRWPGLIVLYLASRCHTRGRRTVTRHIEPRGNYGNTVGGVCVTMSRPPVIGMVDAIRQVWLPQLSLQLSL
jgi:hypothetical protein